MITDYDLLIHPQKLWKRSEIITKPSPIPNASGIYAWFFQNTPSLIPISQCHTINNLTLLYVGISPKRPQINKKSDNKNTIRNRLQQHLKGNAYGSTLRLTLGCLLKKDLGIELRRFGNGKRMTFGQGEYTLNNWLDQNAFISWIEHPEPWLLEERIIQELSLPLNLDQNHHHTFYNELSSLRSDMRLCAQNLPVI